MARFGYVSSCLIGVALSVFTIGPNWKYTARGQTDFMSFYAGAKLAFSHDLYEAAPFLRTQAETEGRYSATRLFNRPPAFAILFWPIAGLPYSAASPLWEALCFGTLVLFVVVFPAGDRSMATLACCWSIPLVMGLAQGQDTPLLLLWIALALRLLRHKKEFAAGLVICLCATKFHLFVFLPVWLLANRKWRMAAGLATGGASLVLFSFANGRTWPIRYARFLMNPENNPYPNVMPGIHGLVARVSGHLWIEALGIAVVGALVWAASRRSGVDVGFATALAGGILVAPHVYIADCAIVIPAALIVVPFHSATITVRNALALLLLTPVLYWTFMTGMTLPLTCGLASFVLCLGTGNQTRAPIVGEVIVGPLKQDQHPVFELNDIEQVYE